MRHPQASWRRCQSPRVRTDVRTCVCLIGRSRAVKRLDCLQGRCRCPSSPRLIDSGASEHGARAAGPVIHFESPSRVAILPSSDIAHFTVTNGSPVLTCLVEALDQFVRTLLRCIIDIIDDLDARGLQVLETTSGNLRIWINSRADHRPNTSVDNRLRTRRSRRTKSDAAQECSR